MKPITFIRPSIFGSILFLVIISRRSQKDSASVRAGKGSVYNAKVKRDEAGKKDYYSHPRLTAWLRPLQAYRTVNSFRFAFRKRLPPLPMVTSILFAHCKPRAAAWKTQSDPRNHCPGRRLSLADQTIHFRFTYCELQRHSFLSTWTVFLRKTLPVNDTSLRHTDKKIRGAIERSDSFCQIVTGIRRDISDR